MVVRRLIKKMGNTFEFDDAMFVRQEYSWSVEPLWLRWMYDEEFQKHMDMLEKLNPQEDCYEDIF